MGPTMGSAAQRTAWLALACLLAFPRPGGSQDLPADSSAPVPLDPAVVVDTLDNGLVVYVRENAEPADRAELRLAIRAGSVLEDDDQRGLAHFVEHMAFNGTANFEKQEIVDYLESIGMRFGPDVNAFTSFDETVYMLTVPTDSVAQLDTGLAILAEWSRRTAFDPGEVEKERPVIVEEWRLGRGARMRTLEEHLPVLLHDSHYAERLPIGAVEVIEGAPVEAMRRFYDAWYRPDLAAVIAVGDFDGEEVLAKIRGRFAEWVGPPDAPARPSWPVPPHEESLVSVVTDPETTVPDVALYHKRAPRERETLAAYRRSIVEALGSAMLGRRLSELARRPDPPFLGAGTGSGRLVETADVVILGAGLHEDGVERGIRALAVEAERVRRHGFATTELEREKRDLLRGVESAYDERGKTPSAAHASALLGLFLSGTPAESAEDALELHRTYLPGIALDEVEEVSRAALGEGSRVVLLTAPEKEGVEVPHEPRVLEVFREAVESDVAPYEDEVFEGPLVGVPPEPGRVVDARMIEEIGAFEWTLSNGARVVLKPTDFRDDEVVLRAWSPGGTSLVPDSLVMSAAFAEEVVLEGGVGNLDRVALEKALAGVRASVRPWIGFLDEGFSGGASPRDLETMFELLWLQFTTPRKDPDAHASFLERMRGFVANRAASPEAAFGDTLNVTLRDHHPRVVLLTPETVERIELEPAWSIYRDRIADADDFTFAIVGAFEPDSIRPLVERWIGSLPATDREETWRDRGIDPPEGVVERTVARGVEPKSRTAIVFTGPFDWSLENVYAVEALGAYLGIRLREELREEAGGTYGVSVRASGSRWPDEELSLQIDFGADPGRIEDLVPLVFAEIEKVRAGEVDGEDLAKVRQQHRRAHETNLRENAWWADALMSAWWHDLDPRVVVDRPSRIAALEPAMIVEAARRWVDPGRYVRVTLVPGTAGANAEVP